jgi:hypothetical protein
MNRRSLGIARLFSIIGALAVAVLRAQAPGPSLGSVHLPRAVLADGKPLAAGTYHVRLTADEASPVLGESAHSERWVEFLKGDAVAGHEIATVISNTDISAVAKGPRPEMGSARVDLLKGDKYLRVWIAKDGQHYLINLVVPPR